MSVHQLRLSTTKLGHWNREGVSGIVATVFGGGGFVGQYVVEALGNSGTTCVIPYRGEEQDVRHLRMFGDPGKIVLYPYHPRELETIRKAVSQSNVVINLIGRDYETRNYPFDDVHVKIPRQIAEICQEVGIERLFHLSSTSAFADGDSKWSRSKAAGEDAVMNAFPDATIFRCGPIAGWEDRFINLYCGLITLAPFHMVPLVDKGAARYQPMLTEDLCHAIQAAIESPGSKGKIYDLGGPEIINQKELLHTLYADLQYSRDFSVSGIPKMLLRAACIPWEFAGKFGVRPFLYPDLVLRMGEDSINRPKIPGFHELGIVPKPLDAMLPKYLLRWTEFQRVRY